jgi:folate-binding protein YgfZ
MPVTAEEYDRVKREGGLADLSARAKFRLTGADRVRYLNGQVTANVSKLAPGRAIPACITTPKGKLCGDLFITAEPDALLIDAEPELREPLLARLERYIISDDVTLEDITETRALLHLLNPEPPAVPSVPSAPPIRANRFGSEGWDFWLTPDASADLIRHSSFVIRHSLLTLLRLEAGLPRWGHELNEDTLPPEAGLDRTHIDYHKGCYIGQEVISRLKSVGHVNRELKGFVSLSGQPLTAGSRLLLSSDAEKPVGTLTSVAWSFALAKPIALGYLKRGTLGERLLALPPETEGPGIEVRACDLPFTS